LVTVLADAFNTIVLARRVQSVFRLTRLFYRITWGPYRKFSTHIHSTDLREDHLSIYGPLSVLVLLTTWAAGLIVAFALMQWAAGLRVAGLGHSAGDALYFASAATFTVLVGSPQNTLSRLLLSVLYQSFASRERFIELMDSPAGSPPSATELIRRESAHAESWEEELNGCEGWCAEILESQISFPMLAYFRCQHPNQSWLGTLIVILDASAIASLTASGSVRHQAELTFAMGCHALVDLASLFVGEDTKKADRLSHDDFGQMRRLLPSPYNSVSEPELARLRASYESYAAALANRFLLAAPAWVNRDPKPDNWQTAPR